MSALCLSMMRSSFRFSSFFSSPALSFIKVSRVSASHLLVSARSKFLHRDCKIWRKISLYVDLLKGPCFYQLRSSMVKWNCSLLLLSLDNFWLSTMIFFHLFNSWVFKIWNFLVIACLLKCHHASHGCSVILSCFNLMICKQFVTELIFFYFWLHF